MDSGRKTLECCVDLHHNRHFKTTELHHDGECMAASTLHNTRMHAEIWHALLQADAFQWIAIKRPRFGSSPNREKPKTYFEERTGTKHPGKATVGAMQRGEPVPEGFAVAYTAFLHRDLNDSKRCKHYPQSLRSKLGHLNREELFDTLFTMLTDDAVAIPYSLPRPLDEHVGDSSRADLVMGCGIWLALKLLGIQKYPWQSDAAYFDSDSGGYDYQKMVWTETGYSEYGHKNHLSPPEACALGRDFSNDSGDFAINLFSRLTKVNRDCFRYALDTDGQRMGMTGAVAISDDAWQSTLNGKHGFVEYNQDEIMPCSNNIVVFTKAEHHGVRMQAMSKLDKMRLLFAAMFIQMALLLDPSNKRHIRCVTYKVIKSNSAKTPGGLFRPVAQLPGPPGPTFEVVCCDPHEKSGNRFLSRGISDALWSIRGAIDEARASSR